MKRIKNDCYFIKDSFFLSSYKHHSAVNAVHSSLSSRTAMQILPLLNPWRVQATARSMGLSEVYLSVERCPHYCLCLAPSRLHSLTELLCYFPPPNPFSSPRAELKRGNPASALPSKMCHYITLKYMLLLLFFYDFFFSFPFLAD